MEKCLNVFSWEKVPLRIKQVWYPTRSFQFQNISINIEPDRVHPNWIYPTIVISLIQVFYCLQQWSQNLFLILIFDSSLHISPYLQISKIPKFCAIALQPVLLDPGSNLLSYDNSNALLNEATPLYPKPPYRGYSSKIFLLYFEDLLLHNFF